MSIYAACSLNAFLSCVIVIALLKKHAERMGLVDVPTGRKLHDGEIPVVGGIGIFVGFVVSLVMSGDPFGTWNLIAGMSFLLVTGVLDDRHDMRPRVKFTLQMAASLILVAPGFLVIDHLGARGSMPLGICALPFTLFFTVGLINAFNLMDGIDGLIGGVAICAFFWMALFEGLTGHVARMGILLLITSATTGFLVFNMRLPWRRRAEVFMGDAGSMMLGAAVAFFSTRISMQPDGGVPFLALLWLCAIPAVDTLSLMARRLSAGRSPFAPDRHHLHHLLLDAGLSPGATAILLIGLSFALGGVGVLSATLSAPPSFHILGLLVVLLIHSGFVQMRKRRRLQVSRAA